jgi:hypothetical protein
MNEQDPQSVSGELGELVVVISAYAQNPVDFAELGPCLVVMGRDGNRATIQWVENSTGQPGREMVIWFQGIESPPIELRLCETSGRALQRLLTQFFDQSPSLEDWRARN